MVNIVNGSSKQSSQDLQISEHSLSEENGTNENNEPKHIQIDDNINDHLNSSIKVFFVSMFFAVEKIFVKKLNE